MSSVDTKTRKEREIAEREQRILMIAREQIIADGYLGMNMDRIAKALEYSKGTIYNHFSCKEEIVIALAVETMEKRVELFRKAAQFTGPSRERMAAIGVAAGLFVELFRDHFTFEQILRIDSVWEKTTEKRRNVIRGCEEKCMGVVGGIVRDAVASREISMPDGVTPEDLVFGLWAMTLGTYAITTTSDSLTALGVKDPQGTMNHHIDLILDGYHWQPLSSEHASAEVRDRVKKEVFADEFRALANQS